MDEADYDKRTALHVAASEGNKPVVKYLLEQVTPAPSGPLSLSHSELITIESLV